MNRPAAVEISYECMRFLITHNPTNATLNKFTEVRPSKSHHTLTTVVGALAWSVYLCEKEKGTWHLSLTPQPLFPCYPI